MKYNRYWFKFMQEKAKILQNWLGIAKEDYFAPEDEIAVFFIDSDIAEIAWKKMKAFLLTVAEDEGIGLAPEVCIFCLTARDYDCDFEDDNCAPFSRECLRCRYRKYHGVCSASWNTDYGKIHSLLIESNLFFKLTSAMYLEIIKKIEKKGEKYE